MEVVFRIAVLLLILAEKSTKDVVGRLGIPTQLGSASYGGSQGPDMSRSLASPAPVSITRHLSASPTPEVSSVVLIDIF